MQGEQETPIANMKTKPATLAAVLALILSLATAEGQSTINPATGLPLTNGETVPAIDPATGLPVGSQVSAAEANKIEEIRRRIAARQANQPGQSTFKEQLAKIMNEAKGLPSESEQSDWIDPNWKDPDIVLTNVIFPGLPLREVVQDLRERFKEQFDVILPDDSISVNYVGGAFVSAGNTQIQLELRDVHASELFSAMNLLFFNNRTPLRWELKVVGHRQIALLRALEDLTVKYAPQAPGLPERRIYFVGDLIGDEKTGGMSMEQVIKTITDVWRMTDTSNGNIQFHEGAQLLIVSGTPIQIDFVDQTLKALRQKAQLARYPLSTPVERKPKPDESKK